MERTIVATEFLVDRELWAYKLSDGTTVYGIRGDARIPAGLPFVEKTPRFSLAGFTNDEIMAAHNDGATAAERLTIGSVFTGAFGAFARTTHDPALRSIFTQGYLWKLRRPVVTDFDNRITSLGPPK